MKRCSFFIILCLFYSLLSAQSPDYAFRLRPDSLSKKAREFREVIRSGNLPLVLSEEEKMWMDEILFYEQDSTERTERAAEIEREKAAKEKDSGNSKDSNPTYSIGAIPLGQGVSPSGARTYSIAIPTAPGFKLVPSVALAYNSQAGEGWAGYGWDIQGISTISLINQNEYYHGCIRAASDTTSSPVFALDGVPLVTNDDYATSADYPLTTATGHILARTVLNPSGFVCKFEVLYPNGCRAVFGRNTYFSSNMAFYRIAEMEDMLGNRIVFTYANPDSSGNDRISSIRYGYDSNGNYTGEIVFSYTYTSGATQRFFAGKTIKYDYRLTGIESFASQELLSGFSFSHIYQDNTYLLSQVDCYNSEDERLPPISFTYETVPETQRLKKDSNSMTLSTSFFDDEYPNIYKRGKFLPGEYLDGLLIYHSFDHYKILGGTFLHGFIYGPPTTVSMRDIAFISRLENNSGDFNTEMTFETGFQTVDAVDVDGDGADEIVKVSIDDTGLNKTKYKIGVRNCQTNGRPGSESTFYVELNGAHYNSFYNAKSPYYRDFRWGDFNGDGKTDLLAIAPNKNLSEDGVSQTCYAAVIDISTGLCLSDEVLFDYPIDRSSCLIVCDVDADGRSELCYATNAGFDIYRLQSNGHFALEKHLSLPNASLFISNSQPVFLTDVMVMVIWILFRHHQLEQMRLGQHIVTTVLISLP